MSTATAASAAAAPPAVCATAAPLSPFLWRVPSCGHVVPVGCEPGVVADVCVQAKDLSLRFEQLAGELEGPYFHAVSEALKQHPVHTHSLSKHQFDVLRYGVVLDASANLVLVPVPRQCGDSGAIVAQGYESMYPGAVMNDSEAALHPLHEEYVFVVYQLEAPIQADGEGRLATADALPPSAKALFRLVFRNEAYLNNPQPDQSRHFPVFILRAIYISNDTFYRVHEVIAAHRKYHPHPTNPDTGLPSPDPRLLVELQRPEVVGIADAWMQVLEGMVPTKHDFEGVSRDSNISAVDLSSPRRSTYTSPTKSNIVAPSTLLDDQRYPLLSSRAIRMSYYNNGQRMEARMGIVQKTRALISEWRNGALDMPYIATEAGGAATPIQRVAQCIRVLFRETRSGHNYIEDGELVAFLPQESDCERLQVYDHLPAERLRLWIVRALLTAELHGKHVLLLELDSAMMIAQCVGLLLGSETNRDKEVLFHLCKIVVETVEDYVQHSGNIWKVTIAVADAPPSASSAIANPSGVAADSLDVNVVSLCKDILECIQLSKRRLEIERLSGPKDGDEHAGRNTQLQIATPAYTPEQLAKQRAPLSENVIFAATTHRVFVTDERLYPLFQYCDTNNDGLVAVDDLVKLFLCKENRIDRAHNNKRGPYAPPLSDAEAIRMQSSNLIAHPLCALDGCGLPFDEKSIYEFIHPFSKHVGAADGEKKLNYLEFSMMMLALAKR